MSKEKNAVREKKTSFSSILLSTPMIVWTLIFVGATIGYVIVLSFLKRDPEGY